MSQLDQINKDINETLDNISRINSEISDNAKKTNELLNQQNEKLNKIEESVNISDEKITKANNIVGKIMSDKNKGFFNGIAVGATTTGIAVTAGAFATGNVPLGVTALFVTGIISGSAAIINKIL